MTGTEKWLVFGAIIVSGWLIYLLAPVLTPFMISALLAYLGDPIVDRLQKIRIKRFYISRTIAVMIVFCCMVIIALVMVVILVPLIEDQINSFVSGFPEFITWLQQTVVPRVESFLGIETGSINLDIIKQTVINNWQNIGNVAGNIVMKITYSGQIVFAWLAYLLLIPVVTFYLLRDWDDLIKKIHGLIPRTKLSLVTGLVKDCDSVLSEFMRGQLLVMIALGIIYTFGLWLIGLESALLIGMLAGAVSFVPYLGFIVGAGTAVIAVLAQYGEWIYLVYVLAVFIIGQIMESIVLSPWLVGDRIGLHPVAVIFAVMAGGQLFGFFGVLVALPAAAVIVVLMRYLHSRYIESEFYTP